MHPRREPPRSPSPLFRLTAARKVPRQRAYYPGIPLLAAALGWSCAGDQVAMTQGGGAGQYVGSGAGGFPASAGAGGASASSGGTNGLPASCCVRGETTYSGCAPTYQDQTVQSYCLCTTPCAYSPGQSTAYYPNITPSCQFTTVATYVDACTAAGSGGNSGTGGNGVVGAGGSNPGGTQSLNLTVTYDGTTTRSLSHCYYCDATYVAANGSGLLRYQVEDGYTIGSLDLRPSSGGGYEVDLYLSESNRQLPARLQGSYREDPNRTYVPLGQSCVSFTTLEMRLGGVVDGSMNCVLLGGNDTTPIRAAVTGSFYAVFPQ